MRRRLTAAALLAVLLTAATAVAAGAATWIWGGGARTTSPGNLPYAISCPSTSLCVMIDNGDPVKVSERPLVAGSWHRLALGLMVGNVNLDDVVCPSRAFCLILGSRSTPTEDIWLLSEPAGPHPSLVRMRTPAFDVPVGDQYGQSPVDALDCPDVSSCLIVTASGNLLATAAPADPKIPWRRVEMGVDHLQALSCPSVALCFGFTHHARAVVSTDPTGGPRAWRALGGRLAANAIDCPTSAFCAASGNGFVAVSTHPERGGWHKVASYRGDPEAIDCHANPVCNKINANAVGPVLCPSSLLCVGFTGGQTGPALFSTNPAGGRRFWTQRTPVSVKYSVIAGSCPTRLLCFLLDENHGALFSLSQRSSGHARRPAGRGVARAAGFRPAAAAARCRGETPRRW